MAGRMSSIRFCSFLKIIRMTVKGLKEGMQIKDEGNGRQDHINNLFEVEN